MKSVFYAVICGMIMTFSGCGGSSSHVPAEVTTTSTTYEVNLLSTGSVVELSDPYANYDYICTFPAGAVADDMTINWVFYDGIENVQRKLGTLPILPIASWETRDTPHITNCILKISRYHFRHAKNCPYNSPRLPASHHPAWQQPRHRFLR